MSVKVSSKYQVVIPEEIREALAIKPGTQVEVLAKGGVVYLVPVKSLSALRERTSEYLGSENESGKQGLREKKDRKL